MRKLKLKINHSELLAMTDWMYASLREQHEGHAAEMCALAVLDRWLHSEGMRNAVRYRYEGEKKMSLKAPEACALMWLIGISGSGHGKYLDNILTQIYQQIHQTFLA